MRAAAITVRLVVAALHDRRASARLKPSVYFDATVGLEKPFPVIPSSPASSDRPLLAQRAAAKFLLGAPRYREGTFERVKAPILSCLADDSLEVSAELVRAKAARARRVQIRTYPVGHLDLYHGDAPEQVTADQGAFVRAHLVAASEGES